MITDGGRVLHIVGKGNTLADARNVAYRNIEKIHFEGIRYRGDIGKE
jgi:phosphoribosylamine--glycine ligase